MNNVKHLWGNFARVFSTNVTIDNQLLKYLVCPLSKTKLRYDEKNNELISDKLGVAYPIKDGIPQLAVEDGRLLQTGKHQSDWSN